MITHDEIGADEDLAREVLIVALDIAPCLASLPDDSEAKKNAIAILRRVYRDNETRGSRMVKSQRIGSAAVEYADIQSGFAGQPTRALRALCGSAGSAGSPRGSFPNERPVQRLWPETYS